MWAVIHIAIPLTLITYSDFYRRLFKYRSNEDPLQSERHVQISLNKDDPIAHVSREYLSFSIDISVLAGGHWWEGSRSIKKGLGVLKIAPIDLNNAKLDKFVCALHPSFLRVGGSEADKISYFHPNHTKDELVLSYDMWDKLHQFVNRNQLKLMFTFKYGLFKRCDHGQWDGNQIRQLLDYGKKKGYQIHVCELGNELNAYWAFHGLTSQPMAKKLAQDYDTFIKIIGEYLPESKISGPGSAFWPRIGETIKPFSNITKKFLESLQAKIDIIDWHYYPFQSERSPIKTRPATMRTALSPSSFADYTKYADQLRTWRDQLHPHAELWTGETGSAQCGGQIKLSDRFASCFWWADQLGQGAVCDQKVMIRQSLIGGEYGLIDRLTLKARPDYWVSWLWVKLMGCKVYDIACHDKQTRIYCHDTPASSHYHQDHKNLTLLIINMSETPATLNMAGLPTPHAQYEITAKKLTSKKVYINAKRPKLEHADLQLEPFKTAHSSLSVKPYSINFWCI